MCCSLQDCLTRGTTGRAHKSNTVSKSYTTHLWSYQTPNKSNIVLLSSQVFRVTLFSSSLTRSGYVCPGASRNHASSGKKSMSSGRSPVRACLMSKVQGLNICFISKSKSDRPNYPVKLVIYRIIPSGNQTWQFEVEQGWRFLARKFLELNFLCVSSHV